MNKDIKQKWITALLSDDYTQGRNCLRNNNDEFCCLGVLCDLYWKETGDGQWDKDITAYYFKTQDGTDDLIPPTEISIWADLDSPNPLVNFKDTKVCLANLNDGTYDPNLNTDAPKLSFKEIAELIDKSL